MSRFKPLVVAAAVVAGLLLAGTSAVAQEGRQPQKEGFRIVGKVESKSGNSFTLETRKGEIKVQYDSKTKWVNGSESGLKKGVTVGVAGTKTGQTLHASKIGYPKDPEGARSRKPRLIRGEVTEVNGQNFTLETRRGDLKVVWNGETKFHNGTSEDVKVGARIGVAARRSGSSELAHAQHIVFKSMAECERSPA